MAEGLPKNVGGEEFRFKPTDTDLLTTPVGFRAVQIPEARASLIGRLIAENAAEQARQIEAEAAWRNSLESRPPVAQSIPQDLGR